MKISNLTEILGSMKSSVAVIDTFTEDFLETRFRSFDVCELEASEWFGTIILIRSKLKFMRKFNEGVPKL